MKQKYIMSLLVSSLLLSSSVFAANNPEKGWWWYEEKEGKVIKKDIDPEKITEKEILLMLVKEQQENKIVNKEILKRLEYAFPNTVDEFSINKKTGEKCKTNSSADCFQMPVIAEGQQVPVLKEFLRNPSPENSKEWLKWQATYFNHVQKVSHGLRFAFLKDGAEAYPTQTDYALGDSLVLSQAENARAANEANAIVKLKENLGFFIFLGIDSTYENINNIYKNLIAIDDTYMREMSYILIFNTQAEMDSAKKYINDVLVKKEGQKSVERFYKKAQMAVKPDLFRAYNVRMTPSIVAIYKGKEEKPISQIILSGTVGVDEIRRKTMNFLTYNEILNPGDFSADKNWAEAEKMNRETNQIKEKRAADAAAKKPNKNGDKK